ncbi:hypothetical protein [Streptomyces sp. NPDC048603]|uniref:hypothetical protein n=1 Tax=Streptomyces sp. NPDC048603 TaxID=3365577 RepID=UPI003712D034
MNHSANINHDAVLRARVALLGSAELPIRQRVAAYRVLSQVSPLAYLPRLVVTLIDYSRQEFADQPEISLALRAESAAAARKLLDLDPGRAHLLAVTLQQKSRALSRQEDIATVHAVISALDS